MSDRDICQEEWSIYLLAVAVSLPIVLVTLIEHAAFEAGATIALVLLVVSVIALVGRLLRRRRTAMSTSRPSARLRQETTDKVST